MRSTPLICKGGALVPLCMPHGFAAVDYNTLIINANLRPCSRAYLLQYSLHI